MSRHRPLQLLLLGACLGGLGCGSTPRDINYGTEAGADFDAPPKPDRPTDATDATDASDASDATDAADVADTADAGATDTLSDGADGS